MNEIKFRDAYIIYIFVGFVANIIIFPIQSFLLFGILASFGVHIESILLIIQITGILFGVFVSFFVFRWSVKKFILIQLPQNTSEPVGVDNPSNAKK